MKHPIHSAGSLGGAILGRLRLRVPDDPIMQRSQGSFALLQVAGSAAALAQALVILFAEDARLPPVQFRLSLNAGLSILLFVSLIAFTARGRVNAGATMVVLSMLVYDIIFSFGFSLRTTPTPAIVTLCLLGSVGLVVPPKRIMFWGLLCAIILGVGQIVTPIWLFQPKPISIASVVIFAVGFYALILTEFRHSMMDAVYALQEQTAALTQTNAELHQTLGERNELSEKLATAERMEAMGNMAGNIAHDFNNMLTVIRGYSDRIASDMETTSPRRDEVDQLVQAVSRASNVSRDVLDFATPIAFAFTSVDLSELLRGLTEKIEKSLHPKVALVMSIPDEACIVCADAEQLQRVFMNLAANARDATPAGGTVHIELRGSADYVTYRVTDQGRGVPEAQRDRIFEPFYTTKGTTGGGGLGLASSYAIVRQHHGYINVDDAPAGGAVFTVELPRVNGSAVDTRTDEVAAASSTRVTRNETPLAGRTVLLVEDDEPLRRLMYRILTRAGALVHAVDNGDQAITELHALANGDKSSPHIIVTDLRLPSGSGAEVVTAALLYERPIAIVAVSGFLEDKDVAHYAATKLLQFLPKPFAEAQLLEAIGVAQQFAAQRA